MFAIHLREKIELLALHCAAVRAVADMPHERLVRRNARVADRRALAVRRQKRRAPVVHAAVRERGADGDEPGQVFVLRAEAVGDPRAHARPHLGVAAGVQLEQRAAVRGIGAVHRAQDAKVVHVLRHVREEFAHRQPALAVLLEPPRRLQQFARLRKLHPRLLERIRFSVVALEQRLRIEGVHVARPAFHEEEHDALRPRRKVRRLWRQRIGHRGLRLLASEHGLQRKVAKADGAALQQGAAGDWLEGLGIHVHYLR